MYLKYLKTLGTEGSFSGSLASVFVVCVFVPLVVVSSSLLQNILMTPYSIPVEEDEVETLLATSQSSDDYHLDEPKTAPIHTSSPFTSRILRLSWSIFNLLLFGINLELILVHSSRNKDFVLRSGERCNNDTTTTEIQQPWNSSLGFQRYDKIFGHVHMAKTAGSEINGELAAHYERVCGHKGYVASFHHVFPSYIIKKDPIALFGDSPL